jgi:hypothetical protein
MIIHKKEEKTLRATSKKFRLLSWTKDNLLYLEIAAIIFAVCGAFLLGAYAQKKGKVRDLRHELGLSDRNLALAKSVLDEPTFTFDALLHAELPTLYIDLGFEALRKIETKREEAVELGLLFSSNADFVPGEIRYENKVVRVDMRLKGDLMDHLDADKWSYRIHVKGDDHLFGMRRFSIQNPATRKYLREWGWLENLRREGVLAPRYQFVNVFINGTSKGIYALEEHFSEELIESQGRREGVIVTFDESDYWQRYGQLMLPLSSEDFITNFSDYRNSIIDTRRSSRVDKDPLLSKERNEAVGLLRAFQDGTLSSSEVFDISLMARFLAVSELWQTYHALYWNNVNFYYNPLTAKLEPIGFDGTSDPYNTSVLYSAYEPWLMRVLEDPAMAEAYIRELDRISRPDYLDQLSLDLDEPLKRLQMALYVEFPDIYSNFNWGVLKSRQEYVRRLLDVHKMVFAFEGDQVPGFEDKIIVNVRNILSIPVEIIGFQIGDETLPADLALVNSSGRVYTRQERSTVIIGGFNTESAELMKTTEFRIPIKSRASSFPNEQLPEIKVLTRILGGSTIQTNTVMKYPDSIEETSVPPFPTFQEALESYPFLKPGEAEGTLLIQKGDWLVNHDLVLPRGARLKAGPGTTLRFGSGAILYSSGPIEFRGTPAAPVLLTPINDTWGGIVVMGAKEPSFLENVIIRDTAGIERGGWILTGGITFYKSPIHLIHSQILGSGAEDGINVVHSQFEFRDCEFRNFASDAFDGDFSDGIIQDCIFRQVQGDAIDLGQSTVDVDNVIFNGVNDKGISAGENSKVAARDLEIVNTGIAIASKDLSHVQLEDSTIRGAIHFGFAAFQKKPEFGPATITAVNLEFSDVPQETLVQTGSLIYLNDKRIEGEEIDVAALYDAGILGK